MPSVGLVSLITLKTGKLLTVLNNSPSLQGEGKTLEKAIFFTLEMHVFDCFFQVNFCIKALLNHFSKSFLTSLLFLFIILEWTDKEKVMEASPVFLDWLDLLGAPDLPSTANGWPSYKTFSNSIFTMEPFLSPCGHTHTIRITVSHISVPIGFLTHQDLQMPVQETKRQGFDPCIGNLPWRRAWQPSPVFLPGESHGERSLVGYGP